MDWLHVRGLDLIYEIQQLLKNHTDLTIWMSHVGNPRNAFLLYFPLAFHLDRSAGVRLLWLAAISEWLNAISKWFLHGERPYWWIYETSWYHDNRDRTIAQYHVTCETGPGSPSGHSMITSAVLFAFIKDILQPAIHKLSNSRWASFLPWLGYAVILGLICVSRCFVAAHFPHQVVAGTCAGVLLGSVSYFFDFDSFSLRNYLVTSFLLPVLGLVTFLLIDLGGFDPFWSLTLAQRWCSNKDWIHLDTTLFASIIRDASCLLGLGLGLRLTAAGTSVQHQTHGAVRVAAGLASAGLMQGFQYVHIPERSPLFFYAVLAVFYTVLVFTVVCISKLCSVFRIELDQGSSDRRLIGKQD